MLAWTSFWPLRTLRFWPRSRRRIKPQCIRGPCETSHTDLAHHGCGYEV